MKINSKSPSFAVTQVSEITQLIKSGTTTSVLGIPGAGITIFLRHLTKQLPGHVVYIETFALPTLSSLEFYKELLNRLGGATNSKNIEDVVIACKKQLEVHSRHNQRVVICIAGFDQLQPEFLADFFRYLRSLRSADSSKVVFIFGTCRRLETLLPADCMNIDLSLFSSVYYLKPYAQKDMEYLLSAYGPPTDLDANEVTRLISLSGGHFQFLQLLLNSERRNNPAQDPFIQLAFKNIYLHLDTAQKTMVRKLAWNGTYPKQDKYLTDIGIIQKSDSSYQLFSPLFADCVKTLNAPKLPIKERRLLAILKKHQGSVVPKQEIYDAVWRGDEIGSEWALNALVYRLRKHPAVLAQHYVIENHKKLGYVLLA